MPEYLSPGVYVEEVPSAVQAIAGVSTSTAGFIGIVPDVLTILVPNPTFDPTAAAKGEKAPRKPAAAAGGEPPAPASTPAARSGDRTLETTFTVAVPAGTARLCTTFTEFRDAFGDFS